MIKNTEFNITFEYRILPKYKEEKDYLREEKNCIRRLDVKVVSLIGTSELWCHHWHGAGCQIFWTYERSWVVYVHGWSAPDGGSVCGKPPSPLPDDSGESWWTNGESGEFQCGVSDDGPNRSLCQRSRAGLQIEKKWTESLLAKGLISFFMGHCDLSLFLFCLFPTDITTAYLLFS